ncbi:MAG: hypothetical protein JO054_09935 [Actinobacteria bacterium]|nr:hypothetical protein [Actinomycetota bacterium]
MRKLAAAVVLLVVTIAPVRAAEGDPLSAVQGVLDRRVAAVRAGDKEAFLATVDPAASAAFKDAQGKLLDGLHSLPLDHYALEARLADNGDLSGGLSSKYGGAKVFLPETREHMRFAGYDTVDDVESVWLTFVERGGQWYVANDRDAEGLGLYSDVGLWNFGPVVVHPTAHFLALSHPAQANRLDALTAIGEQAMTRLHARWPIPWSEKIPMVLPGSLTELGAIIQSTFDLDQFVAFTAYSDVRDDGYANTASRIYIQDKQLSQYDRDFQLETLVHELNHAAVATYAGPEIPSWVHEGVADWVGQGSSLTERKPKGSDGKLPRDDEFEAGSGSAITMAYDESRSAISYLARRAGRDAPAKFIQDLGSVTVAAGNSDYWVDASLRRLFGFGLADLEAGWAAGR